MAADEVEVEVEVGDRSVRITNPGGVYFPARGETKLDLVRIPASRGDRKWFGDGRKRGNAESAGI